MALTRFHLFPADCRPGEFFDGAWGVDGLGSTPVSAISLIKIEWRISRCLLLSCHWLFLPQSSLKIKEITVCWMAPPP